MRQRRRLRLWRGVSASGEAFSEELPIFFGPLRGRTTSMKSRLFIQLRTQDSFGVAEHAEVGHVGSTALGGSNPDSGGRPNFGTSRNSDPICTGRRRRCAPACPRVLAHSMIAVRLCCLPPYAASGAAMLQPPRSYDHWRTGETGTSSYWKWTQPARPRRTRRSVL